MVRCSSPLGSFALFSSFAAALAIVGCSSSSPKDVATAAGAATPAYAESNYDQAGVCNGTLTRHAVLRAGDMKDGLIRWNCGDVPGVTPEADVNASNGYGQEYCEYHGVSNGKIVAQVSDVADGAALSCVFTGVFADADAASVQGMTTALASAANLGATPDDAVVRMQLGFNSRNAATGLIDSCSRAGAAHQDPSQEARAAACWQAAQGASPSVKSQLEASCKKEAISDADWAKAQEVATANGLTLAIAAPGDAAYDQQTDLVDCIRARAYGVPWRNSDPTICARTMRAASECACAYNAVPDAVLGFSFGGWTGATLPAGCRFADLGGTPSHNLLICAITQADRDDLATNPTWNGNLQAFCHDRFAKEIVLAAPVRALEVAGSCQSSTTFCAAYTGH